MLKRAVPRPDEAVEKPMRAGAIAPSRNTGEGDEAGYEGGMLPGWAATIFTPGDVIRDAFDVGRTWTWTAADPLCLGPLGIDPAESECEMEKVKRQICGEREVGWKDVGKNARIDHS